MTEHTAPAQPIDYESKAEKITHLTQIANLLRRIRDQKVLLSVHVPGHEGVSNSLLLDVNTERNLILLDELNPQAGHALACQVRQLRGHCQCHGVELSFSCRIEVGQSQRGISFYHSPLPASINYLQRPLEHQDVRLLHLEPMEHSDGPAMQQELEKVVAVTGVPRAIVSEGGSDVKKGIGLFRQAHPTTAHVYDITHKVALLLKKELEADPDWERFITESNLARRGLTLTPAGFLVPPALKAEARYMNVDCLVEWGVKVLRYLDHPREVPGEAVDARLVEGRLGWLRRYRRRLTQWSALLVVAQAPNITSDTRAGMPRPPRSCETVCSRWPGALAAGV